MTLFSVLCFAAPESGAQHWAAAWTLWRNPRVTWRINWAQYKTSTNRTLAKWKSTWFKPKAAPETCRKRYKQPKTTQTFYWNSAAKMHNTLIAFIQQGCIKVDQKRQWIFIFQINAVLLKKKKNYSSKNPEKQNPHKNIKQHNWFQLIIIRNVSWAANQHITGFGKVWNLI